jgi:predicted dehydrogenase
MTSCSLSTSRKRVLLFLLVFLANCSLGWAQKPVRVAIAGISHSHTGWIFNRSDKKDIEIVGIYETDQGLVKRYMERYNLSKDLFYTNLPAMLDAVKPEAVTVFGPINEHVVVVRACAPRKIHVMVEKPLATTFDDAKEIQKLAGQHGVKVLTNFETSWYASNQHVNDLYKEGKLGEIRRVIVNDGHEGPTGVNKEFFAWLTDPIKNGGGALTDFGCYGANLMTWLMKGQRPLSVTAVTNQNRPDVYPKVDDDATIVLKYPNSQCIIQASWSWSFSRKDMEVYGTKGYAIAVDRTSVRQRLAKNSPEEALKLNPRPAPFEDPFSVLADVVQGRLVMDANDMYELPINVTAVEILDAARRSATSGKTIVLPK